MAGASGPVHVQGCEKQDKSRQLGTPRSLVLELVFIRALSATLHHCVLGSIQVIPHGLFVGAAVRRQLDDQC